jgi:photosystem II stability/assembly factor-like uncharacterized protein
MKEITVSLTFAVLVVLFASSCAFASTPAQEDEESPPGTFVWSMQHHTPGDESIRSVLALNESNVWAAGNGGSMIFYDGTSWAEQESGTAETLEGMTALDENHVWAVGHQGTILFSDGTSWTPQESGIADMLFGVTALDVNNVWAAGEKETILLGRTQ